MENQNGPEGVKDKFLLVYILFYAMGVVTVVPSNFFTTATDYWMFKFRDIESNESYNSENRTALQTEFTSDYSIVSNVSYVAFILITICYVRNYITILHRTLVALAGTIMLFVLTCIFVEVNSDSWQRVFFVMTLIIGFFLTGFSGLFMVTLYEIAVKFPPHFLPAIFSGQAICGIFAALVQIFSLGIGGGPQTTGLVYFLIGMFFIVLSLVAFLVSWKKSDFFRFYINKEVPSRVRKLVIEKEVILSGLSKAKYYMGSMVITLGCSIMLHPGVISLVVSVDKGNGNSWNDTFFGPVVNFLFYFLFDYLGREAATIIKKPTNGLVILLLSLCRVSLVPLILFCNVQPRSHLPVTIESDAAYVIFLIIFAVSNGYLVNLSIVSVPKITTEKERPFAMLSVLMLMILSLAICSTTSTAIVKSL